MSEILKKTEYYTLRRTAEGFVAELNSEALSGVPGLTNIELRDTSELTLMLRTNKVIKESINPTDPVVRLLMATQRRAYQQKLLNN